MGSGFLIGWRQVGACMAVLAVVATIASSYSVVAIPLAAEFKPSRMVLMLAMTVVAGCSAILSPVLGKLLDHMSSRTAMMIGGLFLASGYAAITFAQSFNQILAIYAVLFAPANILIGPLAATVLLSRWFVKRRGTAIGIAIAGIALGGFVFPPTIQALFNAFDWRGGLRIMALIVLVITFAAALLVVNRPAERGLNPDGADRDYDAEEARRPPVVFSPWAILRDPSFWMIAVLVATATAGMKGMVTNLVPLATDEGIDPTAAAFLISLYSGMGFISKLGFAAIADRMNPRYLMVFALSGYAAGTACMMAADLGYWMIALGVGLMGMFGGMMVPLESFLIPRVFGREVVGRVGGLMNFAILMALLVTPPLFGKIFDMTGSYDVIFGIFTGLAVVVLLLLVPRVRLHQKVAQEPAGMLTPEPV